MFFHIKRDAANSLQSYLTLCDSIDGSPPGSPIPGILQARTLEWVAISFSNAWKWKVKGKSLSRVRLWATPWTAAYQAPPSMGFSRQEYWSGVPLPSPLKGIVSSFWVRPLFFPHMSMPSGIFRNFCLFMLRMIKTYFNKCFCKPVQINQWIQDFVKKTVCVLWNIFCFAL